MTQGRRQFVERLVGGAATVGALGLAPGTLDAESLATPAERALLRAWEADQNPLQAWDMSWVDRVTGTYRQVFDAPEIGEGTVFHQARSFLQGFIEVHGLRDADLSAVMVIRHAAIPLAVNDRLWDELELGKAFKLKDPVSGKAARKHPFLNANAPSGAKYSMLWPDGGLDTLLKRGAIGLCCNLALFRIVGMIMERDKLEAKAAREKALANLVPGMIVLPTGIFAVARAQAAGCQYIRAA